MIVDLVKALRDDRDSIPDAERADVYVKRYDVISKALRKVEVVLEDFGDDDLLDQNFDPMDD